MKETVTTTQRSPSHDLCASSIFACAVTSCSKKQFHGEMPDWTEKGWSSPEPGHKVTAPTWALVMHPRRRTQGSHEAMHEMVGRWHGSKQLRQYLRRHLRQLVGLGVQPAEGLQVGQVVVLRQRRRQPHALVVPMLRRHHDRPDLLDLRGASWLGTRLDYKNDVRAAGSGLVQQGITSYHKANIQL